MKAITRKSLWFLAGLLVTGFSLSGQTSPPSTQARDTLNKGVAAFRNGDFQSAIEFFKQAVEIDPAFTTAELYLASADSQRFVLDRTPLKTWLLRTTRWSRTNGS